MSENQSLDISWESIIKVFIAIFIFYIIYLAREIALWFLFGLAISVLLQPAVMALRKIKIPKMVAILIVYLSIFGVLGGLLYLSAPIFESEIQQFSQYLPGYFNKISPFLQQSGISVASDFDGFTKSLSSNLANSSGGIINALLVFFGGISASAFILTMAFFLSFEDNGPEKFLALMMPKKYEDSITELFQKAQTKVAGWFGARLIACFFVGIASYIIFYIFGVPYALTLALISGILNFIPYIGPWITTLLLIGFILISSGSWLTMLYVIIAITVIQEIENKLLSPLLMKKMIDIPPVLVIISLLVGFQLFGFLGAIFAIPICGIMYEFLKDFLENRREGMAA